MSEPTEEEMGFIRAVLANPDDDAIRLIYSDWLEEQGRSPKIIRFQANQPKAVYGFDDDDVAERRCWSRDNFSADLIQPHKPPSPYFCFKEYINCTAKWWLKNADWVLKYHPIRQAELRFSRIIDTLIRSRIGDWFFLVGDEDRDNPVVVHIDSIDFGDQTHDYLSWPQIPCLEKIALHLLHERWPDIKFSLVYDANVT